MRKYVYFIFTLCLLQGCASISAPTGGAKDTTAPKLVGRTIKDSMVNFGGGKFEFIFDEKIDVKNVLVASFPLLNDPVKCSSKKNKLVINIPDTLLEKNTTYKISLGNNLKDIYEGTSYKNFNFTFSMGSFIDSLQLNGKVQKAKDGLADTSAWVVLYSSMHSDSDVAKTKPMYATKVDASGYFLFTNLPAREFYMYAVSDKNNNYLYDSKGEGIAFLNHTVVPNSKGTDIKLYTFIEKPDTVSVNNKMREENKPTPAKPYTVSVDTSDIKKRSYDITQALTIQFAKKITAIDNTKIRLYQDSVLDATSLVSLDSSKTSIKINADLIEDAKYKLQLLEGFAKDSSTSYKANTFNFRTKKEADYGSLKMVYKQDYTAMHKIIVLLQNEKIISSQTINDSVVHFKLLNPGKYILQVINDENNNGKWDNGIFFGAKKQPEITNNYPNEIIIKASWENNIVWMEESKKNR